MRMIVSENIGNNDLHYSVVVNKDDIVRCRFGEADFRLIDECSHSGSIADKLLALELIARRIEEAHALVATDRRNGVSQICR